MLPFDSDHLTPTEQEAERMRQQRNCWNCQRLVRHKRSGYRGCEEGNSVQPVIDGEMQCGDWEGK